MRNPISPTPHRPIPLPDCILLDGWWVTRRPGPVIEGRRHVWIVRKDEGERERTRNQAEGPFAAGP
ncbi:MAG TPA: hypothetical protein GYA10_17510 [Alphaproteobacteria bacterium]|nr:hypothetical protein [Alphaproteobacteria bacterium]